MRRLGFECWSRHDIRPDSFEHLASRVDKCRGSRGRLHAVSRADKQRIVEKAAKLRKRGTYRWLTLPQAHCSRAHAAFVIQRNQGVEQVQVEFVKHRALSVFVTQHI